MIAAEAEGIVAGFLAPLTLDAFFDAIRDHRSFDHHADADRLRANLLGPNPAATLLAAFATHSANLDCHSPAPLGPSPGPKAVTSAAAFGDLIGAYHDAGYTVRFPDVCRLSPALGQLTRALEVLIHSPVETSVFWSRTTARSKIHYDNSDNFSIQLAGRKRWYISTEPAGLYNPWRSHLGPQSQLEAHRVVDAGPGDIVFIPRGLSHRVESTTDSIHVAILFTPMTRRDLIVAALDHLSDDARPFRETVRGRMADAIGEGQAVVAEVTGLLDQLRARIGERGFIETALHKRSGRTVSDLARLVPSPPPFHFTAKTRVHHAPLAAMHHINAVGIIDLAVPGGHLLLHEAAETALSFIAVTPAFAVEDIPGLPVGHLIALVERLAAAGLLVPDQ